jgi:hypothetical protein
MPCSLLNVSPHFRGTCCLHLQGQGRNQVTMCFTLVSSLAYTSTPKIEVTETSVDFHWTTWHYIPEDKNLSNMSLMLLSCENRKEIFKIFVVDSQRTYNFIEVILFIIIVSSYLNSNIQRGSFLCLRACWHLLICLIGGRSMIHGSS